MIWPVPKTGLVDISPKTYNFSKSIVLMCALVTLYTTFVEDYIAFWLDPNIAYSHLTLLIQCIWKSFSQSSFSWADTNKSSPFIMLSMLMHWMLTNKLVLGDCQNSDSFNCDEKNYFKCTTLLDRSFTNRHFYFLTYYNLNDKTKVS